ncbi:hypothetical protein PoB_001592900 [Plakobranchus ocellatus]|uniref:CCHC-type domain-containing protein n=1 Tax=Plakobranchus ocellatus TaxID=259542 RepID=A0AAV3Z603_9GAST|nr:hypothetical protein PoB_001592900 [Plakobranchus ocellatus]
MRCYKCQRYGHGKDRCKKPAAVCGRCGKGGQLNVTVQLIPIVSTAKETMQPAARPVRSFWKNKPFFVTKLRMAVRFSKPVRQLWLNSIKRFQHENLLVPSSPSFEQSQQRPPRMAAEVSLLPCPREKSQDRFSGSQSPESSRT